MCCSEMSRNKVMVLKINSTGRLIFLHTGLLFEPSPTVQTTITDQCADPLGALGASQRAVLFTRDDSSEERCASDGGSTQHTGNAVKTHTSNDVLLQPDAPSTSFNTHTHTRRKRPQTSICAVPLKQPALSLSVVITVRTSDSHSGCFHPLLLFIISV